MFHVSEETDISREIVSEVELDIDAFLLQVYMKNFCRIFIFVIYLPAFSFHE